MLEMAEFEEMHPCSVRACTSGPWKVKEMDDTYYVTECLFGHETVWDKENQP